MPPPSPSASIFGDFIRRRTAAATFALAVAVVIPLGFTIYSNEIWEDFLITYRHSENLIQGNGLVFTPGERVHGFTSPLNVLLPALFGWILQSPDFAQPLLGFRLVSLAGLLVALLAITHVVTEDAPAAGLRRILAFVFPVLAVLEIKTTAYTMNGQEAGLMLGFLAPLFVVAYRGWPKELSVAGGICIAGLMYSRPDAFVHALAAATAGFVFHDGSRQAYATAFARSVGLSILLYLPWLCFTQVYYGSFIPHTIIAKRGTEAIPPFSLGAFSPVAAALSKVPDRIRDVFGGIYDFGRGGPGDWPAWIRHLNFGLELAAVTYCFLPSPDRLGRMASLCALLLLGYLSFASLLAYSSPWYYPPLAFVSILALTRVALNLPASFGRRFAPIASAGLIAVVLGTLGYMFTYSARALKLKQEVTDWNHRRLIGYWLKENVRPDETIFLEPLGYIGYFSQRKIHDYPGLVSPSVVAARRTIGRPAYPWAPYYWGKAAELIKPDWIVARLHEGAQLKASPYLRENYQLVRVFNAADAILARGEFPGASLCYNDAVFEIFRRRRQVAAP